MKTLLHHCPRCGAQNQNFDIDGLRVHNISGRGLEHYYCEVGATCRNCEKMTVFSMHCFDEVALRTFMSQENSHANKYFQDIFEVTFAEVEAGDVPQHLPQEIEKILIEALKCQNISCYNAAASMLRLCIDLASKNFLPEDDETLDKKIRENLSRRLDWLFDVGRFPARLRDFAHQVRLDGNDAVHDGLITKDETADLIEFVRLLFEDIYTYPAKLLNAQKRRAERKA